MRSYCVHRCHDDVIIWKHFPRYWPFVRGIHRSPVNSPHKGQWRGALMFSSIWAWTNGWVNYRDADDLRRHRAHYDVTVMWYPTPSALLDTIQVLFDDDVRQGRRGVPDPLRHDDALPQEAVLDGHRSELTHTVWTLSAEDVDYCSTVPVIMLKRYHRWLYVKRCYSNALAMELCIFCNRPSTWRFIRFMFIQHGYFLRCHSVELNPARVRVWDCVWEDQQITNGCVLKRCKYALAIHILTQYICHA